MRFPPVCVDHLRHAYGKHKVYEDLSLSFEMGKIYGLLGKNGVGKTTLIKIIMGFLKPLGGSCRIFGDPAHAIRPATRERVGLLFERHLAYDFFIIAQVERFMAAFYPRWKAERYHAVVDVLGLPSTHRIAHMSEGQRSQVVLGLMLAQDPDLLVLDDYSLGLDAGYRRLFVDCLCEFLRDGRHTVILTSHVIQDMDRFVDEAIFLRRACSTGTFLTPLPVTGWTPWPAAGIPCPMVSSMQKPTVTIMNCSASSRPPAWPRPWPALACPCPRQPCSRQP